MAAAATTTTLSLVPSLGFTSPSSSSSSSSTCSNSSTSSLFFTGGSHLWSHKIFISVSLKFRTKASTSRYRLMINASRDYYATLGVTKSATGKEIKAAYRRLARQVYCDSSTTQMLTRNLEQLKSSRR